MDCPNKEQHTPCPDGYIARHEWAKRMSKTHAQTTCPGCGLWKIWLPRNSKAHLDWKQKMREDAKFMRENAWMFKTRSRN